MDLQRYRSTFAKIASIASPEPDVARYANAGKVAQWHRDDLQLMEAPIRVHSQQSPVQDRPCGAPELCSDVIVRCQYSSVLSVVSFLRE